jgi:hypothetical protein
LHHKSSIIYLWAQCSDCILAWILALCFVGFKCSGICHLTPRLHSKAPDNRDILKSPCLHPVFGPPFTP